MNDYEVLLDILSDRMIQLKTLSEFLYHTGMNWIRVKYLLPASWIRVEGS